MEQGSSWCLRRQDKEPSPWSLQAGLEARAPRRTDPFLSAGGDHVLEENMVISIEPAIYFDDIGGFRHSDTVLVTKNGYEVMTDYPTDLESLIVRDKKAIEAIKSIKGAVIRKAVNIK